MTKSSPHPDGPEQGLPPGSYEPPRLEQVLTAEDLSREVLYAGLSDHTKTV